MKTKPLPAFAIPGAPACALAALLAITLGMVPAAASAQPAGQAAGATAAIARLSPAGSTPDQNTARGEPNVKRTVIEDGGSRIEELKVRGQTRRIIVTPKTGTRLQYEVLPEDSGGLRDSAAATTPHGNEGRRVWNVLSF